MSSASVSPRFNAQSANGLAQNLINALAQRKRIQLPPITVANPAGNQVITIPVQNVGLIRGFLLKITATIANTDGANLATLANFGVLNLFSQYQFNDYANLQRIVTTGPHLFMVESLRRRGILGAAYTNDNPMSFGAQWAPYVAGATIAHGANTNITYYIYIPVMYDDNAQRPDFRGAILGNVTNANANIQLTVNNNMGVATGADNMGTAVYTGTTNISATTLTITPYQDVYDQLPTLAQLPNGITPAQWQQITGDASGYVLPNAPAGPMSWMYEFKWSPFNPITQNVENVFPYTNQRLFLSTIAAYFNGTARTLGTDINYWRLVAANSYEWWRMDPLTVAFNSRYVLGDDFPPGIYSFESRNKPINTVVSGNLNLVIYPTTAGAGAQANIYVEDFSQVATVTGATSLASGN